MKKLISTLILALVASSAQAAGFTVTSSDYPTQMGTNISMAHVFNGFGCTGENKSPAISWSGAPRNTKSYAVTIYDPDAPTGSGWWHWVVFNIPADVTALPTNASENGLPQGAVQSRTDFGSEAYGGPCPPKGERAHRYVVAVHALDVETLDLKPESSGALVGYMLNEHRLGKAQMVAKFGRE